MSQSVEYDFEIGLVTIRAQGDLDILAASALRGTALKWLAEHPLCLIVDLARIEVRDEIPLLVLPMLARREDAVPIYVIFDPLTRSGRLIEQSLAGRLRVYPDEVTARDAATTSGGSPHRFQLHMRSELTAPARARALVAQACEKWGLTPLTQPAQLIVSELVSNAILHAHSDVEVTVALGEYYVHLHVRDRDRQIPRIFTDDSLDPRHSRGMKLVDRLASGWGTTLRPYGKSVWATLRITAPDRSPSP